MLPQFVYFRSGQLPNARYDRSNDWQTTSGHKDGRSKWRLAGTKQPFGKTISGLFRAWRSASLWSIVCRHKFLLYLR